MLADWMSPVLGRRHRVTAGEPGDQAHPVPAGFRPQPAGGCGGQQKVLADLRGLGCHPRLAVQGRGQVQAVHGEFQDARPEELGEQHAVAVPGPHHAPGRRVPQRQFRLPPGGLKITRPGRRAGQGCGPALRGLDPAGVRGRGEPPVGPVVPRRGDEVRSGGSGAASMPGSRPMVIRTWQASSATVHGAQPVGRAKAASPRPARTRESCRASAPKASWITSGVMAAS